MRKPASAICEQQSRRLACASVQSDQRLCCSLPRLYNISSFYIQNFKPLASFCGCAGRLESHLVRNPKDRFSRDEAQMRRTMTKPIYAIQEQQRHRSVCTSTQSDHLFYYSLSK